MPRRTRVRRRRPVAHTMTYQLSVNMKTGNAVQPITYGQFGVDMTRPCRVKWLKCVAATQRCVGSVFSYTIESSTDKGDAVTRSSSKLLTVVPSITRLSCPRSTDFAYVVSEENVSIVSITTGLQYTEPVFFIFTLCMEFKPAQSKQVIPTIVFGDDSLSSPFSSMGINA